MTFKYDANFLSLAINLDKKKHFQFKILFHVFMFCFFY